MGFVGATTTLHPTEPNYTNNANFVQRHHHLQQQQQTSAAEKILPCDYVEPNLTKSTHIGYLGSENVKRFSVNNLLNLVGYSEYNRNQGTFGCKQKTKFQKSSDII